MFPTSLKKPEIIAAICGGAGFLAFLVAANVKAIDNLLPPLVVGAGTAVVAGTACVTLGAFAGAKIQKSEEDALYLDDSDPVPQPPQVPLPPPNYNPVGAGQVFTLEGGNQLYFQEVSVQPSAPQDPPPVQPPIYPQQQEEVDYAAFQEVMSEAPTVLDPWEEADELPPLELNLGLDISYSRGRN